MQIEFLSKEQEICPEDDKADVLVRLDDGREYVFLVATPKNIYRCMDNENLDDFFGDPPLFVRALTRSNIEVRHPRFG
jgi:hypothetical protein